jgi:translation initiation factor IF-3
MLAHAAAGAHEQVPQVRCVVARPGGDEQLGVIDTSEALAKAQEMGVDLIMISETAVPPVVKVRCTAQH